MTIHQSVFIGRFQPFHQGHVEVAKNALAQSNRLLFLLGSANIGRTTRNPFTAAERAQVIVDAMQDNDLLERIDIANLDDDPYDLQRWIGNVQHAVCGQFYTTDEPNVALTGHERDGSSFYLKKFPQWHFIPTPDEHRHIHGTHIRSAFLRDGSIVRPNLPTATIAFLERFRDSGAYTYLQRQIAAEEKTRAEFGNGPHLTADPVVVQSGHVLVVERGGDLGTGKLALPGGHLDPGETLEDCSLRECFEETKLFSHISEDPSNEDRKQAVWAGFRARRVFDDPYRSCYARVITEAFLYKLRDGPLPPVEGRSDAKRAFWLPLDRVRPDRFFDDHAFIIQTMLRAL